MIEETVTEKGEEKNPLRRSVGMPAFGSEEERMKYMEDRKRRVAEKEFNAEKKKFKLEIEEVLRDVYIAHLAKPSLKAAILDCLRDKFHFPEDAVNIGVDDDSTEYWVEIKDTKYGDLELGFPDK